MRRKLKENPEVSGRLVGWRSLLHLVALSVLFLPASIAVAQVDRSALTGTVKDASGRLLPQTHITAVQIATQLRRETVSSPDGRYDLPELPVGIYTVTFDHTGFRSLTYVDVQQVIGRTRTLDAILHVSGGEEHVEVSASSEQMDMSTGALGGRISKVQAEALPLNGRNWATLTALVPGAVDTGGSNQRSIRFAGRGRDDDNYTYDGIDATNIINQSQQPYVRLAIPLDTIEEFRIESMMATAEAAGTGGPQLAVTSPSGTNGLHGRAFEFLRNNVFDAMVPSWTDPSWDPNETQQPLRLNQFGGSLGGPIVRNKTFFFLAYEGYRQHWGFPLYGYVPSSAFRAQVLAESPALSPIVKAYPVSQTATADPDSDLFTSEGAQIVNEDSEMMRIDQHFSEKTTGFVRVNIDRANDKQPLPDSNGYYLLDQEQLTSGPANVAVELLHVFNTHVANESVFGFNRSTANTYYDSDSGIPFSVSNAPFSGLNYNRASTGAGNTFSEIDNLTWFQGRHTVKAGVQIRRVQMNQGSTETGSITFASEAAFAADQISKASLKGTLPVNGLRKTQFFGYVQDEFRLRPGLTANLGVRYSFFNIFHEVHGWPIPFDFATCGPQGFCGVGASFGQPNYGDIDPRVALAWAPGSGGKTVIRAGFGMYHEDGQLDDQNLPEKNEVYSYSLSSKTTPTLSYPVTPFLANTTGKVSPQDEDRRRKDTYVEQWGLSVQRALPGDFVSTLSWFGSEGVHLLTLSEVNMINPATGAWPYPAFSPAIAWRGNKDNSSYEGFSAAVKRSFSAGLLLSANYMWSHEIDDGSNGSGDGDSLVAENVACAACERASGSWDVRNVLNANGIYQLPFGPSKPYLNRSGWMRSVFGSWETSFTALARTGFPVNVLMASYIAPDGNSTDQRPDLVPGASLTPPQGRSRAQWFNPAAFTTPAAGTFGDAPRNLLRGPGTWQADVGADRDIPLSDTARLQFRAEFFNLFNHPQYGPPQSTFGASGFGSIVNTVNTTTPVSPVGSGTPREIQLALRFLF